MVAWKRNDIFRRSVASVLALVMVLSMMPITALSVGSNPAEENPWSGRSAVFVGDSITAGTGTTKIYYRYLQESLGFGSVTAMGVGGSCISAASDYGQSTKPLIGRYQDIPSADLIVIFMGTNDYGHETPIGSADDTQDGSFYGALNTIIPALVAKHTSSKIVFVTSLHRYGFGTSKILGTKFTYDHIPNGVGATLGDYVQALKTVCAQNGVSVIDLHTECTLDPTDAAVRSAYIPDGIHPNAAGHEVIAGIMESHILGYEPVEKEPVHLPELIQGNKFSAGNNQPCRASSRINYYLKAGTVITLKDPEAMQWACAKTSNENSSDNLGYFPDAQWTDKITAAVAEDGWIGFTFKYRDETKAFDLTKPLSDYITIQQPHTHVYEKGVCTICSQADPDYVDFTGKKVSILSHSMSTYAGVSNNTAYNSTIGSNDVYYTAGRHGVYREDTWWQQTIDALGMELLVNNSWSGSCVFQPRKGAASVGYGDRAVNLHNDHTGQEPDVIFVYLGCNDFAYYQDTFGKAEDVDYAALIRDNGDGTFSYAAPQTACEAYAIMLHKVLTRYPGALVYCMTSTARRDPDYADSYADAGQPTAFMAQLHQVAAHFGLPIVDLEKAIPKDAEIFDQYIGDKRAHANALGMDKITNGLLSVMLGGSAEIRHVTSETGAVAEQAVLLGGSYSAKPEVPALYSVRVTMDGKDITAEAFRNGSITVETVTGDIAVELHRADQNFCWELNSDVFDSVSEFTFTENKLTLLEGSIQNGIFSGVKYALADEIRLDHNKPWIIEWACTGNWDATLFANVAQGGTKGAEFIFRSGTDSKLLAIGEYDGTQYNNYGISTKDLDMTARHVYRLENRVSDEGNMVWLYIDGSEIGPMNRHYIGSKNDTGNTSSWLSGEDFRFGYMGTVVRAINYCSLEYVQVFEAGHSHTYEKGICTGCGAEDPDRVDSRMLRYDDRYDVSGKTVEIIDAGKPTSYKVGYGVAEGTLDDAVVTQDGDTLIATGIGTALVRIDGQLYEITVTAAPISLLLLAGQSNMQGIDGDANQSVVCPDGQVYATYADRYKKTVEDVTKFAPSALTGPYSSINVTGDTACLENYPVHMLTEAGKGREGMDSGLAYEWIRQTGEKVWVINLGYGGSSITQWQAGGEHYEALYDLFTACQETLRAEIAAGHFTLSHMGYFWCQGCADETQTAKWYVDQYLTMHETFKTNLAFDTGVTFEFAGIVPIRSGHQGRDSYRAGAYTASTTVPYFQSFKDLRFNGPRVAQYWMGNNPELTDIWNVCTIQEGWATLPDGTNGVAAYFCSAYENGRVDYPVQVTQAASWYTPTTPAAVHDNIHYNQIGYNELGREAARNALILLGETQAPDVEATVEFMTWDGFTPAERIDASTSGCSGTLVVPMVYPVWKSKEVSYTVSEGLRYVYYDLLTDSTMGSGTLTAVGAQGSVTVAPRDLTSYSWSFDGSGLANDVSDGFVENKLTLLAGSFDGTQFAGMRYQLQYGIRLLHGQQWGLEICLDNWSSTAGTMILSSQTPTDGQPYFYFRPSDRFVGIGCYEAGIYHNYGISLLNKGISWDEGSHTFRFVNSVAEDGSNAIWLFVDGVQIGTLTDHYSNSTLTDTGNNWLSGKDFVLSCFGNSSFPLRGCKIDYILACESGYDPNLHLHSWSAWQTVTLPSAQGPGVDQRTCATCGQTETRETEGVWQTHDLADHLIDLPESYCAGTDLWDMFAHDPYYYYSGERWGIHESGQVYSVTLALSGGERIWATSFGKYGQNNNTIGTGSGIRVTFFDANGVLKTMDPNQTYAEFAANGCLTVPEGAVAVNIPMYSDGFDNDLYILSRDHSYSGTSCTLCGSVHPQAANYSGKVISILGDSISTFAGYIPVADGFNLAHKTRYPQDNLLTDVNETWWMQVIKNLDAKLGINDSWASTEVYNYIDAEVNSTSDGTKACMASVTRIQNLGSNGTPDVILFFGGTNDITQSRPLGTFDPATAPTEVDLISVKWNTVADAYVAAIMRMQHYYPDTQIVAVLPYYRNSQGTAKVNQYNSLFAAICEHYGVAYVDLRYCGISNANIPDGTHPDADGMDYITDAVLDMLMSECNVTAGEHIVHSVTHNLTEAESSLGYYKGVSHGKSFATTITGERCKVTVTMGGVDITASAYADGVVNIPNVTGDIVICAAGQQKSVYADYLQQLPETVCAGINLWTALEPINLYYRSTGWGINATGLAHSVTIPIAPGDQLWATSFQAGGVNGGTRNGIALTWFDEASAIVTMSPDEVYAEFSANGYLTAPEGAVAVNVVMWNGDESNAIYILSREHDYKGTTCTICGAEHPEASDYSGKVISILGDSISTFAGYIPVADGFNLEHLARYPQDNLLTDVNETWWMQVVAQLDAQLGINDSWRGSTVSGYPSVTTGVAGYLAAMSNLTQIQNLGSNGTPDVILFYGGTNDLAHTPKLGSFDPATAPTQVDLTTLKWDNMADGYVNTLLRLKHFYPDAQIVCLLPTYTKSNYSNDKLAQGNALLAAICEHYGVAYVDLRYCGISTSDLPDGIHPDAAGMDYITAAVLETLFTQCQMTAGENTVYSVSHTLNHVEASLGYYKGISAGKPFAETLSFDGAITVTVIMGGEDITEQCYADGKISIASVTGDLVITAKAAFSLGDRLQQLPDPYYGVNLWPILNHDADYYSADGWTVHSSGKVKSVTIPVTACEKLYASSFAAAGTNGGTVNGIRITFFSEDGVLVSMAPDAVYKECKEKGYVTVPAGANAVNIPMWTDSDAWELYILNREHIPGEAVKENERGDGSHELAVYCDICGKELSREVVVSHIPGDITGDGEVNNKDLTRLFKYLTGYEVEVVDAALDVNGDGSVNNKDQTRLFRYLSGYEVEIN